jgi:hypothetical protein
MGGGLMQLVAYGAQDIYLTGNPQITFFKVVYRRHTNFSMEAIQQTWNGSDTTNGRCTATISRNGDLVYRMYLEVGGTTIGAASNPGSAMIKSVELEIGGQKIDKHTGVWMETWAELTEQNSSGHVAVPVLNTATAEQTGTRFQNATGMGGVATATAQASDDLYRVPLQFWFCRNPGLALPLIALQYHEVKVILDHAIATIWTAGAKNTLWADYIYLDTDERRRFAQVSHEYLIEQVQDQTISSGATSVDLNFNHPVKELIWTATATDNIPGTLLGTSLVSPVLAKDDTIKLKLNGHDRFAERSSTYFSRVQPLEYHAGAGLDSVNAVTASISGFNDSICVYSFALKPEEHQPSGTCNFSRIDNAQLLCTTFATANISCFAVNYNVLRIMSGMGGLAYSN